MRIDTNSRIYKFVQRHNLWPSDNLCVFVWQFVFSVLKVSILWSIGFAAGLIVSMGLVTPIPWALGYEIWELARMSSMVVYMFLGLFIAILLLFLLINGLAKGGSILVRHYFRAKKNRFCPTIEFFDSRLEEKE